MALKSGKCCHLRDLLPNKCPCQPEEETDAENDGRQKISAELERRLREAFAILDRGEKGGREGRKEGKKKGK